MPAGVAHAWDHEVDPTHTNPFTWMDAVDVTYRGRAPKHNRPLVFIDTEFTGFPVNKAHPVDVCAIKVRPNGAIEEYESLITLDDYADKQYHPKWKEIVGYDAAEWAEHSRPLDDVARELFNFVCGCGWVSHGDADVELWSRVWSGLGIHMQVTTCLPVMCTETLARGCLPSLGRYTLAALCDHFGIEKETTHRARGGAERSRQIWQRLCQR